MMHLTEYIQFQTINIDNLFFGESWTHECESDQVLCIRPDATLHYHVRVQPFTVRGAGLTYDDHNAGELIPILRESFLVEITSLINDADDFTLAFKISGTPDYESGYIEDWDYELLGKLEQDGNNLVVKPLEAQL